MGLISATLTVDGPASQLSALRDELVASLRAQAPETRVSEHHHEADAAHLEFHLQAPAGLPYPPLADVSIAYPECVLGIAWEQDGASGTTSLRAGRAEESGQNEGVPAGPPCAISLDAQGLLACAIAMPEGAQASIGYCATAVAETFFKVVGKQDAARLYTIGGDALHWDEQWRVEDGAVTCDPLDSPQAISEREQAVLEKLAAEFRAHWLWYEQQALVDTILERQRFEAASRSVAPINVKSRRLDALREPGGHRSLDPDTDWIRQLLVDTWIAAAQPD